MPGDVSRPRAAALQGLDKMRANLALRAGAGAVRAAAAPGDATGWRRWGRRSRTPSPAIAANAMSASAMWAANAATVSPAPDTADGKCHLTVANLRTMPHRSHEWRDTLAQLRDRVRRPGVRGARAGAAGVRRRGRGQSHAACRRATASRGSKCSSMAGPAAPSLPASMSKRRRRSRGSTRLDPERDPVRRAVGGSDCRRRVSQ